MIVMGWVIVGKQNKVNRMRSIIMRSLGLCLITFGLLGLAGCSSSKFNKYGVKTSERVYESKGPLPKQVGVYKVGKPYKVGGKWYYPRKDVHYNKTGMASWYGDDFHGRKTANGEVFDMHAFTGAHKTLPLPSLVKVTNLSNNKSIIVRVNDRGPYHGGRLIDMSRAAANALGYRGKGLTKVRVEYFGEAAKHPVGDDAKIAALGGKANTGAAPIASGLASKSKPNKERSFFDHLFGWNKPTFVAESASVAAVAIAANAEKTGLPPALSEKLTLDDMQEFDPDIASAVSLDQQSMALARSVSMTKNQGRMLNLNGENSMEIVEGRDFIQVARFNDIKQAVEYKKQLGGTVYSKIDIGQQGAKTIYMVMVQV